MLSARWRRFCSSVGRRETRRVQTVNRRIFCRSRAHGDFDFRHGLCDLADLAQLSRFSLTSGNALPHTANAHLFFEWSLLCIPLY